MLSPLTSLITVGRAKKVDVEKTRWILRSIRLLEEGYGLSEVTDGAEVSKFVLLNKFARKGAFAVRLWGCFGQFCFFTVSRSRLPGGNHGFASDFSVMGI